MAQPRNEKGQFIKKMADKEAIFHSKMRSQVIVLDPAVLGENKGKRIEFVDGVYRTRDLTEIEALKKIEANPPNPFVRITCVQDIE